MLESNIKAKQLMIFAYAGNPRKNTGQILHKFYFRYNFYVASMSWSPSGKFLAILTNRENQRGVGEIFLFKYNAKNNSFRKVDGLGLERANFVSTSLTSNIWIDKNSFIIPRAMAFQGVIKIKLNMDDTFDCEKIVEDMGDIFAEQTGMYSMLNSHLKDGAIFVSPFYQKFLFWVSECKTKFATKHRHDFINIYNLKKKEISGKIYLPFHVVEIGQNQEKIFVLMCESRESQIFEAGEQNTSIYLNGNPENCPWGEPWLGSFDKLLSRNINTKNYLRLLIFTVDENGVPTLSDRLKRNYVVETSFNPDVIPRYRFSNLVCSQRMSININSIFVNEPPANPTQEIFINHKFSATRFCQTYERHNTKDTFFTHPNKPLYCTQHEYGENCFEIYIGQEADKKFRKEYPNSNSPLYSYNQSVKFTCRKPSLPYLHFP